MTKPFENPPRDCTLCPRLAQFRQDNRKAFPDKFNAPVPAFGGLDAAFLVVGLAPGLRGANFSGRPFTGDWAGDLLYATLLKSGFAKGTYGAHANDGLELVNARITNAVRCVPPENKPIGDEMNKCRPFLQQEMAAMPNLKVILCLGKISHDAVVRTCGEKLSAYKFGHGAVHKLGNGLMIIDSYHCSRYNTNTGRLTTQMFEDVFEEIKHILKQPSI
ncbi:MAG: uracil-DNA glycosylase [Rhodospirillales bacterium]|nr:uracil-DNA glycosylase [Rhodospirillales bacterium]